MHVLVVHNRYRSTAPSGENVVVDDEIKLLESGGVRVTPYIRSSDEIAQFGVQKRLTLPVRPIYSAEDAHAIRDLILSDRPDVMHLHNPYPLISPQVVQVAKKHRVPVLQTVHNYRMVCMVGTFLRNGRECRDCLDKRVPWPGLLHGCYRSSRAQSATMASSLAIHHRMWRELDHYLALTPTIATFLSDNGVPRNRITVRPNFANDPGEPTSPAGGVLFVGRLSEEKGLGILLDAWGRHPDGQLGSLTIVGDGPMRGEVHTAAGKRTDIHVAGPAQPSQVGAAMRSAELLIVPSICAEVMPRVVVESFAQGRPVLATNLGGLPDMINDDAGWVVAATADALAGMLPVALAEASRKGVGARSVWAAKYSPRVARDQLLAVYDRLIADG